MISVDDALNRRILQLELGLVFLITVKNGQEGAACEGDANLVVVQRVLPGPAAGAGGCNFVGIAPSLHC